MAEIVFTAEHDALRAAVRRFCGQHAGEQVARRHLGTEPGYDRSAWAQLGSGLGVLAVGVPEDLGGAGGTLVDQAVVAEELGAALACGPIVGTVFLGIPLLAAAPAGPVRDELLPALAAGTTTAAAALADRGGAFTPDAVVAAATRSGDRPGPGPTSPGPAGGWLVSGDLGPVADAGSADVLLVVARAVDGPVVLAVDLTGPGVDRRPLTTLDQTRPQARVALDAAPARLVVGAADTPAVVDHALRVGSTLLAAEQVGASQHLLDLTVAYAKTRVQFGRSIGSFQAVKHHLADLLVECEHARSTAQHAAFAAVAGTDDPALAASIAQATCSAAYSRIAADTVQLHGGIGFTWEHQAHLHLKRATADAALLGSAEQHRDRVARLVLDTATAVGAPPVATG